jgi:hypothetical protein
MRRYLSLIFAVILLSMTCSGCFWDRNRGDHGGQGQQDRGGYGGHDGGGQGGHDGGGYGEHGGRDGGR